MKLLYTSTFRKIMLYVMTFAYVLAGVNHFLNPQFYYPLFPNYLQKWGSILNSLAGFAEVILAIGLLFTATRKYASVLIIIMLLAFLPVHIYFIEVKSCIPNSNICVPEWVGWIRLIIIHPILIFWAYFVGNLRNNQ